MPDTIRTNPIAGCCGLECGLCPRYHTEGSSRCPGCGGEDFTLKHPSCGFVTCCVKKHGLQFCGQCPEFPCAKFDNETGEKDSFISHRNVLSNSGWIASEGAEEFLGELVRRQTALEKMIAGYDDGRSKSFYCIASALLSLEALESALDGMPGGDDRKALAKELRVRLEAAASEEKAELKLRH